jgi:hypothetical protein
MIAVAAAGVIVTGAPASAESQQSPQVIIVHGTADGLVTLSRKTARAGRITFRIDSAMQPGLSSGISLFSLAEHVTLTQVFADIQEQHSADPATRAKGTRDATRDARFYGLADVMAGTPASVTQTLHAGTYYLFDAGFGHTGIPPLTTLRVRDTANPDTAAKDDRQESLANRNRATVYMTSSDRFIAPRVLPANGTIEVRNVSDTLHFMNVWPTRPGTTDEQVQAYLDSGLEEDSPFVDGPAVGLNVISPGRQAQLGYNLPPGTYVLFCEIPDDRTGIPHVFMGMYKIVTLR